jgi:hypothetical protein
MNNGLLKEVFIYSPFYFIKNNVNLIQNAYLNNNVNGFGNNILILLANLFNNVKYNFDDVIINALLVTIKYNQNYFINVDETINFVSNFYDKNNNDFNLCITSLNKIISSNEQYNNNVIIYNPDEFLTNKIYYNCFYTSYSVGVLFDNSNKIIISTINNLYSLTNQLTNIEMFSLFYKNKTFDIKQYQNILSSSQISDGFIYYKNLLFNVDISIGDNALLYYQNIVNGITKYIFDNFTYLINYIVSDFVFKDLLLVVDGYVNIYNTKNNSNINLYDYFDTILNIDVKNTFNKFQTNNIIVIYLLYFLFVLTCLNSDVINFINNKNTNTNTFSKYIQSLYTENIYLNCLENFITIINNSTETLIFNYSTIYIQNIANGTSVKSQDFSLYYSQPCLYNIIFSTVFNFDNTNYFENKLLNYNAVSDYQNLINKVFINQYNINDIISWYQLNINYSTSLSIDYFTIKQLSYNIPFYNRYRDTITAILNSNEKLFFTINNKFFTNFITNNKLVSNDLFTSSQTYVITIYEETLVIIKKLYDNLILSFQSNKLIYYLEYQNLIINQIFTILKKFFDTTFNNSNTYSFTLLFSNTSNIINQNQNINDLIKYDTFNITTYDPVINDFTYLRDYFIRYFNVRIISSINIEKNINRFIYNYINQYVLKISNNNQYVYEYLNNKSPYDYIKMYNNIYTNSSNIQYETNLALYQNDVVFEILNFLNYTDKKCFSQNPIFNDFIINFSLNPLLQNSFYNNFKLFVNFLILNKQQNLFNKFILVSGVNVIDYFLDLFNLDEFHNYIFDFINLTEAFSPISIYDNIINLQNNINNNISGKLNIDFDNIMKKITIYLFIVYIINANLFNIINDNIYNKILKNYTLEYNFETSVIKINLNDVFENDFYILLKEYIYCITVFDTNYPSIYNINNVNFKQELFFNDIKNNTNSKDYLNLCQKYISSYEKTIGFNNIYTTTLISQSETTDITISNLVENYNILLNIDQSNYNTNNYYLTNSIINIINIYYSIVLKDINEINTENVFSQFTINNDKYYTNTQIKNINIFFILLVYLLSNFNISYSGVFDDLNNIMANFRIGTFNLSEIFEELKGYTSDNYIKNNTINFNRNNKINSTNNFNDNATILSRSQNITDLSFLVSETKNYSNTIPIDFDYDIININMGSIYNKGIDIYKKYYLYNYNFYKFQNNYTKIYNRKYNYYINIINSDYALLNIKKYSNELFNKIFIDIIYTWLSQSYFNYNGNNVIFEIPLNQLLKLYMKYYYTFKLNPNISNVENLKIQKNIKNKANTQLTLNEFNYFIDELYFYELYGIPYTTKITGTVSDNFTYFIQQLELQGNYNFEYINYVYNFGFNLENSIILISWYLKKQFNITTDFVTIKILINEFVNEISSFTNISQYWKNYYLYYNSSANPFLYNYVVNSIDYNDFINRFSSAVKEIIYYTQNISFSNKILYIYETYFKNVIFYYQKYVENNVIITPFTINVNQMQQYIYSYLNYILSNHKTTSEQFNLNTIFKNIIKQTFLGVNLEQINIIYKWIFKEDYVNNNLEEYINNLGTKLYDLLITNYWGIIYSYYDNYYYNKDLSFKLLIINYGTMIIYNPNLSIEYIYNINFKLEILYRLKIFSIMINNITDYTFQKYFLYVLTNSYKYIYNDNEFFCLNLENDVCIYLDFVNSNIIDKNLISNYYKNIQKNTIEQIVNYNVNNFYNYNVNLDFLPNIYNLITTSLNEKNETNITNIFLNNTIINILNQYNNINVVNYTILQSNIQYIDKVFDTIIFIISKKLDIFKNIFGGTNKTDSGIRVSLNQLINIFGNNNNYIYNNNSITIFTLIYDNFNNLGIERINYNMLITLFYYICMIIYILNKWDVILNDYFFSNSKMIINELINIINRQIYNYLNKTNIIETNIFFNGLNELLFNTFDNQIFINKIINFFDNLINIRSLYNKEILLQIQYKASLKTYSGNNISFNPNFIDNMLYKKYVVNNKILIWKNMLVNIVDVNKSEPIFNMKSLMYDNLFDIPASYIEQIKFMTDGLFDKYGMLSLIENLNLYIGDELIDKLTIDMLIIMLKMLVNINVLSGLNQMLGINDTNDFIKAGPIKPYILQIYNKALYLPLIYFFRENMNAIPIISCMYSDIFIKIKNSKNTLFKNFYLTTSLLTSKNKIKTSALFDYILLERTERKRLTLKKQDNLIEKHNFYTVTQKIKIEENNDKVIVVNFDFNINGLIKELFWTFDFFINGYLIDFQNNTNINDLILSTIFYIDGVHRDGIVPQISDNSTNLVKYNYNNITRLLNPYRYNTRVEYNNNINTYSFAFEPEKFQPTGTINMDKYNTFRIQILIDKSKFVNYFGYFNYISNLDTMTLTLKLSTLEYNLIRYQSGLAGLLFYK